MDKQEETASSAAAQPVDQLPKSTRTPRTSIEQPTESSVEQNLVQKSCSELYGEFYDKYEAAQSEVLLGDRNPSDPTPCVLQDLGHALFDRERHVAFLKIPGSLHAEGRPLSKAFVALENSQPWIIYWTLHALDLLGAADEYIATNRESMVSFLMSCQTPSGGFGGGSGQAPHLATTYAAVSALAILGALDKVDRKQLQSVLISWRQPKAGYIMQVDGETDMRGCYCAIASASLCGVLCDALTDGLPEYIGRCQRHDGGIAGDVGGEAHAGYAYCGLAALCILNKAHTHLNLPRLADWLVHRQLKVEGGFNGRPQKLVDACYSFWVPASFPLLRCAMYQDTKLRKTIRPGECWISPTAMKAYLILCCQPCITKGFLSSSQNTPEHYAQHGGLCDKPGKKPDFYHTCYGLSGMSVVQNWIDPDEIARNSVATRWFEENSVPTLAPVNPMFNLTVATLSRIMADRGKTDAQQNVGEGVQPLLDFMNWDATTATLS